MSEINNDIIASRKIQIEHEYAEQCTFDKLTGKHRFKRIK